MADSPPDAFGNYLKKISRYRLLADEEVVELCNTVQHYIQLIDSKTAAPGEDILLARSNYEKAKRTLMLHNIRFVAHVAKRYQSYGVGIEDLVQEGVLGLNRAIELFKPAKGYKFTTYAFWWVRQAITKSLNLTSKSVKMPPDIQVLLKKIKHIKQKVQKEKGYVPSIEEIAQKLNKSQNRIYQALNCTKDFLSIDNLNNQHNYDEESVIAAITISPELISQLSRVQQLIIIRKYGLDGDSPMPYKDIAKLVNRSPQTILKEKNKAFAKLRELCI